MEVLGAPSPLEVISAVRLRAKSVARLISSPFTSSIRTMPSGGPKLLMRTRFNAAESGAPASAKESVSKQQKAAAVEEEEYEEVSLLTEKLEGAREATQAVIAAVPGPRVGSTGAPWLLVVPAAYLGLTFVIAVVRTIQKFTSPRAKRRRQVNKNAGLMESIDEALEASEEAAGPARYSPSQFNSEASKFGFSPAEVVRKYVRYALNEKPFSPQLVSSLIQFRQASGLSNEELAEVLNDIAQRTVKAKGRVMMDTAGFTEKGLQRKAAVQGIFSKLLYLSELDDFLSPEAREKMEIRSIFGVMDEDVDQIRISSLSSTEDLDKLEKSFGKSDDEEPLEPAS